MTNFSIFPLKFPFQFVVPPVEPWKYNYDLAIFYDSLADTDFVEGRCSRWDVSDYSVIIETWLKKSDAQTLRTYLSPGAVGELYKILGQPLYYDQSWDGSNTLRLFPTPSSNLSNRSTLNKMRSETLIYPKNISEHPIGGTDFIEMKIEGQISGSSGI